MVGKRLDPKNGGCSCRALGLMSPLGGTIASVFLFSFPKPDWRLWTSDKRHIVLWIGILPSPSSQAVITATSSQLRHAAKPARRSLFRALSCVENIVNSTISTKQKTKRLRELILFWVIFWNTLDKCVLCYGFWDVSAGASSSRPAVPLCTQGRVIYLAKGAEK